MNFKTILCGIGGHKWNRLQMMMHEPDLPWGPNTSVVFTGDRCDRCGVLGFHHLKVDEVIPATLPPRKEVVV